MRPLLDLEKTALNSDWKVLKIKRVLDTPITDGPHETPELLEEGIPFLSAESVKKGKLDFNLKRGYISQENHEKYIKKCKPQRDDIFMIKSGATTGNVAMVETDEEFSIWSPLALIRADKDKILPKYLYSFIGSAAFREQVEVSWSFGTQQNIGMKVIENLFISVPPIDFQEKLVMYMENKTVQIDEIIERKEKCIRLLEQQRQSIITEAVTKGLNPNVKMKDSGVEWIGEIPEHWDVTKIKYVFDLYTGGTPKSEVSEYWAEEIIWITPEDLSSKGKKIHDSIRKISLIGLENSAAKRIPKNSLVISTRAPIGNLKICIQPYSTNQGCKSLSLKAEGNSIEYYYYLFSCYKAYFNIFGQGTTFLELSSFNLLNIGCLVPTSEEQKEIAIYLNDIDNEYDKLISNVENQIERLKEYRQSLIYEAVTGKIDVRDMELD